MACKIIYKGISYNESDFKSQIERYIAINNLFNENESLANAVYEALEYSYTGEYSPAFLYESGIITPDSKDYLTYSVKSNKKNEKYISNLDKGKHTLDKGIGKYAYYKFIIENKGKNITTDTELSVAGRKVLEQLEKEGYVTKTDAKIIENKKAGAGYNLEVYDKPLYEFTEKIPKSYLTPQQKTTAQQLYSQYLDTIFPDSKIKDIVYHVNKTGIISSEDGRKFYSTSSGSWLEELEEMKGTRIPIILNITNPTIVDSYYEFTDKAEKFRESGLGDEYVTPDEVRESGTDSVIGRDSGQGGNEKTYVTYSSNQVYQLGTKQDIEGFKEFVDKESLIEPEITLEDQNNEEDVPGCTTPF